MDAACSFLAEPVPAAEGKQLSPVNGKQRFHRAGMIPSGRWVTAAPPFKKNHGAAKKAKRSQEPKCMLFLRF